MGKLKKIIKFIDKLLNGNYYTLVCLLYWCIMNSDIEVFVQKFPKEFNELVDIFKKFKLNNNTDEISREEAVNIVNNDSLKEFLRSLSEDELKELFKLLGIKLKSKVCSKTKKTKISIINSILQKMLWSGLQKEQEDKLLTMLLKMPNDKLEQLDKYENFKDGLFDKLINRLLNVNIKQTNKVDDKTKKEDIVKIRDKFGAFSRQVGETIDLKKIKRQQAQQVSCI